MVKIRPWLNQRFEHTKAGKWLLKNGSRYNFHLSFPRDNPQGIMYEPWHWLWKPIKK